MIEQLAKQLIPTVGGFALLGEGEGKRPSYYYHEMMDAYSSSRK